jgi:hypothetical protein
MLSRETGEYRRRMTRVGARKDGDVTKTLRPFRWILIKIVSAAFTIAVLTGFRCPLHGCPACRMTGQS